MLEQAEQTDGTVTSPSPETSEAQPTTFTQEQQDAAIKKGVSDALATAGREAKTLETERRANVADRKALNERETALRKTQNAAEDETFKDDPGGLNAIHLRREAQRIQEANAIEREALDEQTRVNTAAASVMNANRIAAEEKVDGTLLLEYTEGISDSVLREAKMKEVAQNLQRPEAAPAVTITPDPGTGGGGKEQAPRTSIDNARSVVDKLIKDTSKILSS